MHLTRSFSLKIIKKRYFYNGQSTTEHLQVEQGINYFTWNCEHPIITLKIPFFDVSIATLIDIQVNIHTFDMKLSI